jgi:trk system potassium uptake protein TrkA
MTMAASQQLFILVIGCGRLGSYLANALSHAGASVVVVDYEEKAFEALSTGYSGFKVEGDATELGVLKQARIAQADIVIGATHEDNVNIMIGQVAQKIFHVPRVMVRVLEPRRVDLCRALGIECICPTAVAGDLVLQSLARNAGTGRDGGRQ